MKPQLEETWRLCFLRCCECEDAALEPARSLFNFTMTLDGQLLHVDRSGTLDTKLARWTISAWATCIVAGLALVGSSGGGTTTQ
ncbi:hypothetical protein PLESTB_000704700 [Pleodorina starrii]|uniref:Uncharacterized protein n=1 Tax=Pleodorina starrii TaxID=330485 RepID=A0A9W6F2D1_9CHLO|nr:hypothetical protein PLESTB_000704700 [Pleodorina starrii]